MNRVEISGVVTRDVTIRYVGQRETALVELSLAVKEARYDATTGEDKVHTAWISVQVWGSLGEHVVGELNVSRGDEVYVVGKLDQTEVEKDGKKDRKTRVVAMAVSVVRTRTPQGPPRRGGF